MTVFLQKSLLPSPEGREGVQSNTHSLPFYVEVSSQKILSGHKIHSDTFLYRICDLRSGTQRGLNLREETSLKKREKRCALIIFIVMATRLMVPSTVQRLANRCLQSPSKPERFSLPHYKHNTVLFEEYYVVCAAPKGNMLNFRAQRRLCMAPNLLAPIFKTQFCVFLAPNSMFLAPYILCFTAFWPHIQSQIWKKTVR
jgi:hypothetical protein